MMSELGNNNTAIPTITDYLGTSRANNTYDTRNYTTYYSTTITTTTTVTALRRLVGWRSVRRCGASYDAGGFPRHLLVKYLNKYLCTL